VRALFACAAAPVPVNQPLMRALSDSFRNCDSAGIDDAVMASNAARSPAAVSVWIRALLTLSLPQRQNPDTPPGPAGPLLRATVVAKNDRSHPVDVAAEATFTVFMVSPNCTYCVAVEASTCTSDTPGENVGTIGSTGSPEQALSSRTPRTAPVTRRSANRDMALQKEAAIGRSASPVDENDSRQ